MSDLFKWDSGEHKFLDEDNMASNSATAVPSQQSVKAYVDGLTFPLLDEDDFASNDAGAAPSQQSVKAYVDGLTFPLLDEDDFASNDAGAAPSQQSVKAYVDGLTEEGTYTPAWTATVTNPTIGNGSLTGRYVRRGKRCLAQILMVAGSTTTFGSGDWGFSLPFAAGAANIAAIGMAHLRDVGTNNYPRFVLVQPSGTVITTFVQLDNATNMNTINATAPFTWGSGDSVTIQVEYEIE